MTKTLRNRDESFPIPRRASPGHGQGWRRRSVPDTLIFGLGEPFGTLAKLSRQKCPSFAVSPHDLGHPLLHALAFDPFPPNRVSWLGQTSPSARNRSATCEQGPGNIAAQSDRLVTNDPLVHCPRH